MALNGNIKDMIRKFDTKNYKKMLNEDEKLDKDINKKSVNFLEENSINEITREKKNPFSITIRINIVVLFLFIISFLLRFALIDYPKSIVFDEMHYGRFVSLYMKRTFYFDSQPPLGKQLVALMGFLAGYNGDGSFTSIGTDYLDSVPLKTLRFLPCLCGSFLVILVYYISLELNINYKLSLFASILYVLENSLLTQSRFILMDTILIFFSTLGIYFFLLFRKTNLFSKEWFTYLFLTSFFLSIGICVKFVGITWLILCLSISLNDYWYSLPNKNISSKELFLQSFIYFISFIWIPIIIYICVFYVHLSILTKAGPHDTIMTSAFQASLDGGLSSIIKGQPLEIAHGSQITLKHTHGRVCWLHSHKHIYPIYYPDGRGSSHQQQVTCYSFKDVNNWWIVKRPNKNDLISSDPLDKIKHGDVIQLVHGITSRTLNSHDVAAPMSPQHQEVSCYINYNISMDSQNLWRVDLLNKEETNEVWHTIVSYVRLIHLNSSQALKFSGKQYPDWGFNQHEIVTDRNINNIDAIWNVEEHRYTKLSDDKEREKDLAGAEFVPILPTKFTFWGKMKELQYKMLIHDQENIQEHIFSADSPLDLILLNKGIAYWINNTTNSQIFLIGNLSLHYICLFAILFYMILLCYYLLRRCRKYYDLNKSDWEKFKTIGLVCFFGYILHLLPLFFTNKTLFYHHYLPSILFKIIILAALLDHFISSNQKIVSFLMYIIVCICLWNFIKFLPLSYGIGLETTKEIENLKWKSTWSFIMQTN